MIPTRLGDVATVKSGYAFKSADWLESGVPVIKIANVKDGRVSLDGCSFVSEAVARSARAFELQKGDLLISMTGHIGQVAKVRDEGRMLLNQRVGRFTVKDRGRLDAEFLFHWLRLPDVRATFEAHAYGAAQPNISPTLIEQQAIPLPPRATQRRIASILGAYDDLIEVNRHRIAVLEEMARRLFGEWFVDFRFPGHSETSVESKTLPDGWRYVKLSEAATINGATLRPGDAPPRIGYVDIASVSPGTIENVEWMSFDSAPGRARRRVKDGSVIWSTVRPNRRSFALVLDPEPDTIVSTGFAVLDATVVSATYLYLCVTQDAFVAYLSANATGAAYPAVTAAVFERSDIVLPPRDLLKKFSAVAEPQFRLAAKLQAANAALAKSRDLLLPRLISGELPVATAEHELEAFA